MIRMAVTSNVTLKQSGWQNPFDPTVTLDLISRSPCANNVTLN